MAVTHHPHNAGSIETDLLDGAVEDYPSDMRYVRIAIALSIITAVEVDTYVHADLWEPILVPALLGMMAVKFFMVAWFFMHLKYDKKLLTWSFYAGVLGALAVYIAVLATFRFFS